MRRLPSLALLITTLAVPSLARADYREWNAPFEPPLPSTAAVVQVGEVIVMEGDGVITDGSSIDLDAIVARFYETYPDDFDGIAVFLTFPENGQMGGAYAICQEPGVSGIGTGGGGCPGGSQRLLSVVSMNTVDQYGSMDETDLGWFQYIAQEFGHSWLTFFRFIDPVTGQESEELLGRQTAHWSVNTNARGSFMDGVGYTDNGDGTFTVDDVMVRFPDIDLYAMGIIPAEEVQPIFLIRNPTFASSGAPVPTDNVFAVNPGDVIAGTKVDITIDDIIAAVGPRTPSWDDAPEEFRQAFVLVTAPGETAAMVGPQIAKLETGRLSWEERFAQETMNRGFICTSISTPCPIASAKVLSAVVVESASDSDGDGIIEPGETADVQMEVFNTGGADANAIGEVRTENPNVILPGPTALPTIAMSERATVSLPIGITGEACGQEIELEAVTTIESRSWKAPASFRPGLVEGVVERFDADASYKVDLEFNDSAATGKWTWGVPVATTFVGRIMQPAGCHGGATDPCWVTDLQGGTLPTNTYASEISGGQTSLTSTTFDLSGLHNPTLRFWLWYVAFDRPVPSQLIPSEAVHLSIDGSADGGRTWEEIGQVFGGPFKWEAREIGLPPHIASSQQARFRFVAKDDEAMERLVEVAIDDVQIVSFSPECAGGGGGGCGCTAAGRGAGVAGGVGLGLFAMMLLAWRVRARR